MPSLDFRTPLRATLFTLGLVAAAQAGAQTYGSYADHQVDLASALDAAGNVSNNAWVNLTTFAQNGVPGITGYPGFPGTGAWPAPIASQVNSTGSDAAALSKVANGNGGAPYVASGSMYFGGFSGAYNNNGGTLRVTDSTPLANLQTVVFQVGIGEAWTYDFYNGVLPTLSYTTAAGTTTGVAATFSSTLEAFFNGTVSMPTGEESLYINQYGLQWDLSSVSQPITSFSIDFTGVQHAQLYGMTLTQSDVFTQVVAVPVPEPETYALMLGGLGVVLMLARRRRQAA